MFAIASTDETPSTLVEIFNSTLSRKAFNYLYLFPLINNNNI